MEVTPILAIAAVASSGVHMKKSIDTQRKQIKAANKAAKKQNELNVAKTKLALEKQQQENENLLRRQQAAYKARLGSAGMSDSAGSGQAVLDSMQREHDAEDKYLVEQSKISLDSLMNRINETKTKNLLSLSLLDSQSRNNIIGTLNSLSTTAGRTMIQ